MLSQTLMGSVALFAMWITTLLVLATAGKQALGWWNRWRVLRPLTGDVEGVGVVSGDVVGPGPLARHAVLQAGRWGAVPSGAPRVIVFHDRSLRSEILGGSVSLEGVVVEVPRTGEEGEVWAPDRLRAVDPDLSFPDAYERSRQTRGFERTLQVELTPGSRVWIAGQKRRVDGGWRVEAPEGTSLLVSTVDPRAFSGRKILFATAVMMGILVAASVATALAVWPPRFGTRSVIGATLCLAYFLLVQPLATWLRDALLPPSRPIIRGVMVETPELLGQRPGANGIA